MASLSRETRRYVFEENPHIFGSERIAKMATLEFPRSQNVSVDVVSADSDARREPDYGDVDLILTDPPYFDYIAYDELSAFYRAWLVNSDLAAKPLHPPATGDRVKEFGTRLGRALWIAASRLKPTGLLAFTYHSSNPDAWSAVGIALDEAALRVTALWPVLTDPHMGHHGKKGSCEHDLVVVARPSLIAHSGPAPFEGTDDPAEAWVADAARVLQLGEADRMNLRLAYETCSPRWGVLDVP
ncbi:hypothetical protein Aph01nite_68020 [Acrocarpospora phusangensis]|uniref:Methyltransferase n=2 Tax=Acrocarpospora phusangensis TaxID=1070424 RepID=A0A919QGF1_9ACTN|nr:hypothetical protein Aph01nite_68020 [Acrocarpospora phusangensis]